MTSIQTPRDRRPRAAILYDGDCGFCRWALAKLLAWDRRGALRPLALQTPEAKGLLAGMPEQERMASWHLVEADGAISSAGAAFAPLLRMLPGGGPAAALADRLPKVVDRCYRSVAGRRDLLGPLLTDGMRRRARARIAAREGRSANGSPISSHGA